MGKMSAHFTRTACWVALGDFRYMAMAWQTRLLRECHVILCDMVTFQGRQDRHGLLIQQTMLELGRVELAAQQQSLHASAPDS